jgi:Fe-Mn family superoxide dismutase
MLPKNYQLNNIAPELSVKMFEAHWKLYEGYINQLNDTLKLLANPYDPELLKKANPASGKLREIETNKTFLTNAVLLHELFFENVILPDNSAPTSMGQQMLSMVQKDFPHIKAADFWDVMIKPISKSARGWCIVGANMLQNKLDVCMLDSHGGLLPIGLYPLLVIDVYEHAYSEQYGIDRGTYLEHLRRSVNWSIVEHRLAVVSSASEMMRVSVPEEAEEYIRDKFKDKDKDFGFPGEDDYPEQQPPSTGLDQRNELSIQPNPRAHSSVEDAVTLADLDRSRNKIVYLAKVTFQPIEDLFDQEVRGRSPRFREALWAKVQEMV